MSLRNFAEPVTLVRSPAFTNRVSASMLRGSSRLLRQRARRAARDRAMQQPDVFGRRATAAAHDIHQSRLGKLLQDAGGLRGRLVILAERVWQAGVGIGANVAVGDGGELGDVGPQLPAAERAIESDEQG